MYWVKTPSLIKKALPTLVWDVPSADKTVYLTFDDGPTPEITDFVLDQLERYQAKATFFCIGKNVDRYTNIYKKMLDAGHSAGNHTYDHPNGWETSTTEYLENTKKAASIIDSDLFRPPYGRITPAQWSSLKQYYHIVMWDVLSGDFDHQLTGNQCLSHCLKHIVAGSVVVFHDSVKAKERLLYTLPNVLKHYSALGFNFKALTANDIDRYAYTPLRRAV